MLNLDLKKIKRQIKQFYLRDEGTAKRASCLLWSNKFTEKEINQ